MCLSRFWCCSGSCTDVHRVRARKGGGRELDSEGLAAPDTADVQTGAAVHECALEWARSSFTTRITQCGTLWKTLTQEQKKMATRLNNSDLHVHYNHEELSGCPGEPVIGEKSLSTSNIMMVPSPRSCVGDTDAQEFRFQLGASH